MPPQSPRLILGVESSCDETAAAIVEGGLRVRSNVIASQHDLHAEYRGVVPEIASRAHAERLLPTIRKAVADAGLRLADIDAIAVSSRPGLIGALLVGVAGAKALALALDRPIIGVDHVHAHLYAGLLDPPASSPLLNPDATLPALGLVVSGGHTSIYLVEHWHAPVRLGATIDDAIGEAYDKVGAILGLPFPGGPLVDRLAQRGRPDAHRFPISLPGPPHHDTLDFSFSGLKTAVLYAAVGVPARGRPPPSHASGLPDSAKADLCAAFQHAAVAAVTRRLRAAAALHPAARTLLVGGGVSANSHLRAELTKLAADLGLTLHLPAMPYCLDNAAMLAGLGHHLLAQRNWLGDPLTLTASPMTLL